MGVEKGGIALGLYFRFQDIDVKPFSSSVGVGVSPDRLVDPLQGIFISPGQFVSGAEVRRSGVFARMLGFELPEFLNGFLSVSAIDHVDGDVVTAVERRVTERRDVMVRGVSLGSSFEGHL